MAAEESASTFRLRVALACLPAAVGWAVVQTTQASPAALLERCGELPPAAFVAAVAVLPLVGFPLAPLYAFAGLHYGWEVGYALAVAGVAIDLALAYPIYGALLRRHALALLERRGWNPARWATGNRVRVTVLIASIPALPFWAQNAVLAALGTPFRLYFPISLAVQAIFAAGGVALGVLGARALDSGALTAGLLLALPVSMVLIRLVRRRFARA